MSRFFQALSVTLYAIVLEAAAFIIGLPLLVGEEAMTRNLGVGVLLSIIGAASVFSVAFQALRHGPINTAARGAYLGLWAAGCFYIALVLLFGVLPSLPTIMEGQMGKAVQYLGSMVKVIVLGSYGLPIIVGVLGGAIYGKVNAKI